MSWLFGEEIIHDRRTRTCPICQHEYHECMHTSFRVSGRASRRYFRLWRWVKGLFR